MAMMFLFGMIIGCIKCQLVILTHVFMGRKISVLAILSQWIINGKRSLVQFVPKIVEDILKIFIPTNNLTDRIFWGLSFDGEYIMLNRGWLFFKDMVSILLIGLVIIGFLLLSLLRKSFSCGKFAKMATLQKNIGVELHFLPYEMCVL